MQTPHVLQQVLGIDLKEFCELYPGLIGWVIINLAMAHEQYARLGYVTNALVLVNAFQLYYVVSVLVWCVRNSWGLHGACMLNVF